jgi:hydrogenase/urease accessory protein HupE
MRHAKAGPRRAVAGLFSLLVLSVASLAGAHALGLSRGDYRLDGSDVVASLVFARSEIVLAVPELETDDGALTDATLASARDLLQRAIVDRIDVRGDGSRCTPRLERTTLTGPDALTFSARFSCSSRPSVLDVDFGVVSVLTAGHRHLAHADLGGTAADWVAFAGNTKKQLTVGASRTAAKKPRAWPFFRMGVEHILTGYDHLLFLAGLMIVATRIGPLAGAITAFTLAHSVTLALATLGIFAPSPRLVEPAIALSIAYVGVENVFAKDETRRWRVTFPFGLVHGFGFAAALRDLSMPKSDLPIALFSFNAGVETGQLAVIALVLPALLWARSRGLVTDKRVKGASLVVACVGLVWFVLRVTG